MYLWSIPFRKGDKQMDRIALRPQEAADAIGISRAKAYELIASGELPSIRIGASVRVPVDELKRWIAERAVANQAAVPA
jgi:excisionase family DNA binding protein